jgi:predicted dehydrogenase
MHLAIIGCGYVSNMYRLTLPLHPELVLVGVYDTDSHRARHMAEMTGSVAYTSLDDLLSDDDVELVLNLTNPKAHYDVTRACLEAGKHVYTEKPIALDVARATDLVAMAESRGLQLSSAPCTLLNPAAQSIWKALRENPVGRVRLVYAQMDDGMVHSMPVDKWINEAGVGWPYQDEFETGCTVEHAGYVLTWLAAFFGPAESVTAYSTVLVPDKVPGRDISSAPDFSVGCIRFQSGVVARLTFGIYAPLDHSFRVFGDDGVIELVDPRNDRSKIRIRRYVSIRRRRMLMPLGRRYPLAGRHLPEARYRGSQRRDFCSGVSEMVAAIREGRDPRLSARFCLHVNELTLALHRAGETGAAVSVSSEFVPPEPMEWALTE